MRGADFMYKLVIFDLDGTLLNTLGDLAAAGNHALSEMGYPTHEVNAYRHFVGNGRPNLIHRILPENHTEEQHSECNRLFSEYYAQHKTDRTAPYEGIAELLAKLKADGIKIAVNTNKDNSFSCELLKSNFGEVIDDVIGFGAGFPAKPAPDAALELIKRFGANKPEALYVGDSNVDMQVSKNAEIDGCAVLWGFRDYEELAACSPRHIAKNTDELYEIITK